ncbi:MAG: hypothetical protein QGI45_16835 [Myxococcota bacterium]|jgi:hypothetical protein|nr:hypothetical protein [Myxococcota bacterium]
MQITKDKLLHAEKNLRQTLEHLSQWTDTEPLLEITSPDLLLKISLMACRHSPDHDKLEHLLSGSIDGVRALSHLATELSIFSVSDLNIWAEVPEPIDNQGVQTAFDRFEDILNDVDGLMFWQCAHCEALVAEFGFLQLIASGMGMKVDLVALILTDAQKSEAGRQAQVKMLEEQSDTTSTPPTPEQVQSAQKFYVRLYEST